MFITNDFNYLHKLEQNLGNIPIFSKYIQSWMDGLLVIVRRERFGRRLSHSTYVPFKRMILIL